MADCLGTDGKERLFALLNNTGPENLEYLQDRLLLCGMEARPVLDEPAAVSEPQGQKAGLQLC